MLLILYRERLENYFFSLAKIESINHFSEEIEKSITATAVVQGTELFILLADLIDIDKEKNRLRKEIQRLEGLEKSISTKLDNPDFVKKAPEAVVNNEKEKLINIRESLSKIIDNYQKLVKE